MGQAAETTEPSDEEIDSVPSSEPDHTFAGDGIAFGIWCEGAKIIEKDWPEGLELFKKLDDFKLPTSILTLSNTNIWDPCNLTAAVQGLTVNTDLFVDEDVHDTGALWQIICATFSKLAMNKSGKSPSEALQRLGLEDVAMVAFTLRGRASLNLRIEDGVQLCRSDSTVFPRPVTIASLLAISPPLSKATKFDAGRGAADARSHLFWGVKQTDISIILFAAEFKRKVASTNRNQLIMDLSSAQYHRRALGLKQEVLFGATFVNGCLQFYASQWAFLRGDEMDNEMIFVYPVGTRYDISQPISYLRCHSILCNMNDRHFHNLAEEFQGMEGLDIAVAAKKNSWLALTSTTISAISALGPRSETDNAQAGNLLTIDALAHHTDGDREGLPLHIWKDVLMYPPQDANLPAP
ncbi:hypothetical protein FRB93_006218 [Tulasnella sp. JGI-2019a]|nr:hypothetical protein FRB93_006218 [Tulasnella sp. JGI-2019a]